MNKTTQIAYILLSFAAIIFLPLIGSWIHHSGSFPEGFFAYPMLSAQPKAPFNWIVFGVVGFAGLALTCLYLFPSWFGFMQMPVPPKPKIVKVKWPLWFWIGLISFGTSIILLWTKSHGPVLFLHWSDFPLFWGLVLLIDGWAYKRNGGKSLMSEYPQEIVGIGLASAFGWMLFEYLNFFVDDNWYYPFGNIIDREQFLLYAIIISTGLIPLAFVFYGLFNTIPVLENRFTVGPKIVLSEGLKTILLVLSVSSLFLAGLLPDVLFFTLWLSPALVIGLTLDKLGIWTPLQSIGKGNWRPTLVFALTYLAAGLCLECENYFSGIHAGAEVLYTQAPAYWQYDLPYVNRFHLFEMPILGFLGYMPFSLYCWVYWIAFAYMQGIPSVYYKEKPIEPNVIGG